MTVTTDQFIANVKRRITIPASQALMSDEDILAHGDHQMRVRVLPMIKSIRQEFFVNKKGILASMIIHWGLPWVGLLLLILIPFIKF